MVTLSLMVLLTLLAAGPCLACPRFGCARPPAATLCAWPRPTSATESSATVRWPVDKQVRSYVFFVQDANGRITYRAVDEFVPRDKPKAGG